MESSWEKKIKFFETSFGPFHKTRASNIRVLHLIPQPTLDIKKLGRMKNSCAAVMNIEFNLERTEESPVIQRTDESPEESPVIQRTDESPVSQNRLSQQKRQKS